MESRYPRDHFNEQVHPDACRNYIWLHGKIAETRTIIGGAKLIRQFDFEKGYVFAYVERGRSSGYVGKLHISEVNAEDVECAKNILKRHNKWKDEWNNPPPPIAPTKNFPMPPNS